MGKFECVYYDGCSFSTTVNGKELVDFTKEEINTVLKPILCWLVEHSNDEESRRGDYADFITSHIDFGDFDDEYDNRYMKKYNECLTDYTIEKLKSEIIKEDDLAMLQMLYENLMREFGEYEDLGYCEQCGSYNSEYKYTIEM